MSDEKRNRCDHQYQETNEQTGVRYCIECNTVILRHEPKTLDTKMQALVDAILHISDARPQLGSGPQNRNVSVRRILSKGGLLPEDHPLFLR